MFSFHIQINYNINYIHHHTYPKHNNISSFSYSVISLTCFHIELLHSIYTTKPYIQWVIYLMLYVIIYKVMSSTFTDYYVYPILNILLLCILSYVTFNHFSVCYLFINCSVTFLLHNGTSLVIIISLHQLFPLFPLSHSLNLSYGLIKYLITTSAYTQCQ